MSQKRLHRLLRLPAGQAGFTIIELLIATVIFAVIMITVTAAILQFSRQYYKGVVASSTQNASRTLIDDVVRSIEFDSGDVVGAQTGQKGFFCVGGSKRYSYALNQQISSSTPYGSNQGAHALVSDTVSGGCSIGSGVDSSFSSVNLPAGQRELLNNHMRLVNFKITAVGDLYQIDVRVAYGDNNLLCSPSLSGDCDNPNSTAGVTGDKTDLICRGGVGTQFCATSELSTIVKKRIYN